MQIEVGKFYRTRDGRKVGPMLARGYSRWPWSDGTGATYCDGGQYFSDLHKYHGCDPRDLIAEWTDELPQGHARLPSGAVVDLTAIREPFGLLDAETQEALRAHGGPWEVYSPTGMGWVSCDAQWMPWLSYRVKPQPPAPVVETVTHYWNTEYGLLGDDDPKTTHRITFNLIDGVPDPASIRMVAL